MLEPLSLTSPHSSLVGNLLPFYSLLFQSRRVGKGGCCVDPTQDVSGPFDVFVWGLGFPLHVNKKGLVLTSSIYFFNHEIFVNLPCE